MKERAHKTAVGFADGASPSAASARAIQVDDNSLDTRDLFIGTREVIITHGSDRYRLRLTAQNKLILTK
ncbi:hemin uptake protein HemP [Pseudorhodoplanes sp.]|jgi:hemin uptake protein HemP|uniref:hemin uptake protein HemP n=1 Tax=Pseudorhodoplanes sp. TaxID=1934341 RepID=UPI002CBFCE67|nr:hemin uptake protein HemP [Pseudorhodoplanes sp.]HWV43074.1 hemin uptake protein HemP [Pseudorhodoplanes sp.]